MALGELTKQLAQQALLSATAQEPAAPAPAPAPAENVGATVFGQISAMQKALKPDEELVLLFQSGGEKIRVTEIFLPSWRLAVLSGTDTDHNLARVITPVESLQLIAKVGKAPAGAKPRAIGLFTPKPRDSAAK